MHAHPTGVSRAGTVILDIGGEVGAAVVVVPASLAGIEIEIRAEGDEWAEVHTAVREREMPAGDSLHAAVFESLPAGRYQIRVRHGERGAPTESFAVDGGRVTELAWPQPGPRAMPTMGALKGTPPVEPWNGASPNAKIPPSEATIQ